MKKGVLLFSFVLMFIVYGCAQSDLPPAPGAPSGAPIGEAINLFDNVYADPFDIFDDEKPLIISLSPADFLVTEDVSTISLDVKVNHEGPESYVWKTGYYRNALTKQWIPFEFPQLQLGVGYIESTASITLDIPTEQLNVGENYVLAYSCKKHDGEFKCSCPDIDHCNIDNKDDQVWMVQSFNFDLQLPPVFDPMNINQVVNVFSTLAFEVTATDPNEGEEVTISVTGLPSGAGFFDETAFKWSPNALSDAGTYEVTFTASDGISADTTIIVVITVNLDLPGAPGAVSPSCNNNICEEGEADLDPCEGQSELCTAPIFPGTCPADCTELIELMGCEDGAIEEAKWNEDPNSPTIEVSEDILRCDDGSEGHYPPSLVSAQVGSQFLAARGNLNEVQAWYNRPIDLSGHNNVDMTFWHNMVSTEDVDDFLIFYWRSDENLWVKLFHETDTAVGPLGNNNQQGWEFNSFSIPPGALTQDFAIQIRWQTSAPNDHMLLDNIRFVGNRI